VSGNCVKLSHSSKYLYTEPGIGVTWHQLNNTWLNLLNLLIEFFKPLLGPSPEHGHQ